MRKLLLYHAPGCGYCDQVKKVLANLVPKDRIMMRSAKQKKHLPLDLKIRAYPTLLVCLMLRDGSFEVAQTPDKYLVKVEGNKEPNLTNFIGVQLYNITNLYQKIENGEINRQVLAEALLESDKLD